MREPATKQAVAPRRVSATVAALVLLTSALWGGTPVAIRYSVESFPPVAIAACRFATAALFMIVWCHFERTSLRLRRGQVRLVCVAGVLLFLQIFLFNQGVARSNASHGAMHINTFVFWVVTIEHFFTKADRLTSRKLAGLLLAAVGVAVVLTTAPADVRSVDSPNLTGDLLLLLSACILGIKIVFIKQALRHVEPGKLVFWHAVVGLVLFSAYSLAFEPFPSVPPTTNAVLGILYQGIFVAGLCFAIQTTLLRKHSASQISVFAFTTPLFGVTLAVLMRNDHLSPWLFLSAACVAVGILLANQNTRNAGQDARPASEALDD
ncbi:MAG: DMT family transporter [Planctomycetes bacterium]|nr:DMT family transporter [Planctomycetota bacterium]